VPEAAGRRLTPLPVVPASDDPRSLIVDPGGELEVQLARRTGLVLRAEPAP
jgi:hypothetical protein